MELKVIEGLLEKYLEGETSLQEEAQLSAYFSSDTVAPHLQEYVPMFGYFSAAREDKFSGEFVTPRKAQGPVGAGRRKVYSWVAVAASIAIMAGIFFQENPAGNEFGSYEDPELAMQKTKEALNMVSQMMNSGNDDLRYLNEFNNTKNKILK